MSARNRELKATTVGSYGANGGGVKTVSATGADLVDAVGNTKPLSIRFAALFAALAMLFALVVAVAPQQAWAAASGTVGTNVVWELDDSGTLTIKPGSGGDTGTLPNTGGIGNPPSQSSMESNWPWYKDHRTEVKRSL